MPRATTISGRIIAIFMALVLLLSGCSLLSGGPDPVAIPKAGGTAAHEDGDLAVSFKAGQLQADTEVVFTKDIEDAPPPVPGYIPLGLPFDIALSQPAKDGIVRATYKDLPDGLGDAGPIVMLIENDGQWQVVRNIQVNRAAHTITGQWPHFSRGYIAKFNPFFSELPKDLSWTWDKVKAGGNWLKDQAPAVANLIASGVVGATGGTLDPVKCKAATPDWTVKSSIGMTACVDSKSKDGSWPVRVNDRYPYPMLVKLPKGVVGPGWIDMLETHDPVELALAMVTSRYDRLILPAGKTVTIKLMPSATAPVELSAKTDPYTTAAKAFELLALYYTRGKSIELSGPARIELAAMKARLKQEFKAAREAGSTAETLSEYIYQTQGDDGMVETFRRALTGTTNQKAFTILFKSLALADCILGQRKAWTSGKSFSDAVGDSLGQLIDQCYPILVDLAIEVDPKNTLPLLDDAKAKANIVKELAGQARNIRTLLAVSVANELKRVPGVKPNQARITISRPGINVVTAARDAFLKLSRESGMTNPGNGITLEAFGEDWISYKVGGQIDKVKIDCEGVSMVQPGTAVMCGHTPRLFQGGGVAVRAVGQPPVAETVILTGDFGMACNYPWVLDLLGWDADNPVCQ